jgi:hypothetical protein
MNQAPEPSLLGIDWTNLGIWLWSVFLCLLGGFVRFTQNVQAGHARAWNFTELIGEMAMSAFVGSLAYKGCLAFDFFHGRPDLIPAIVGVTSHMGARALFKAELLMNLFASRKVGMPLDVPAPAVKGDDHAA